MCDNSLIADQFRQRLDKATIGVDEALESVRALREAILAQVADGGSTYLDEIPQRVTEVVEVITQTPADGTYKLPHRTVKEMCSVCASKTAEVSIYTGDELYISQDEYLELMKCKDQVKAINGLIDAYQESAKEFDHVMSYTTAANRILYALEGAR
jgi:phage I-like protein